MERRLPPLKKSIILILSLIFCLPLFAQHVSQEKQLRFFLWAQTDAYPGIEQSGDDFLELPVSRIKELAPFIIDGMLYGWKFEYTPYDKARGVAEYFDFSPVQKLTQEDLIKIGYKKPWVEDDRLNCWIEFNRTESQLFLYRTWNSIGYPHGKGTGMAPLSRGFDGIKEACKEAVKNAVREYWRTQLKNKPKEISGTVLMVEPPKIGIDSGRYKVTLDFFIETDKIKAYQTF